MASMRIIVFVDDKLLNKAIEYSGLEDKNAVLNEGLKALVERESARRLARLGGSDPDIRVTPRGPKA